MKILYLAHRVPFPPNKGDKIRSFHEIKFLSQRHEIHLLAFYDDPSDAGCGKELEHYCRSVTLIPLGCRRQIRKALASMLRGRSLTLGFYESNEMRSSVRRILENTKIDVAIAFSSSMAPYIASLPCKRILDFVDSDASKWRQYAGVKPVPLKWFYGYEANRLAEFEHQVVQEFDSSIFVSPRESRHFSDDQLCSRIHYVQNGVDLEYFAPVQRNRSSRSIIFTGAMDYFPNVDAVSFFAHEVFPRICTSVPDAEFVIVGSRPAAAVLRLSRLPGVRVTGAVRDVRSYLGEARVAVAPIRLSQGIQNKILEALATGLPVVATSAAAAGLVHAEGLPLSIADEPGSFSDRVVASLETPLTSDQVGTCRRSLAQNYDWDTNLSLLDSLINARTPAHH